MFSYIRYFSAIAFVLVLAAAFFLGQYFKELAGGDLIALVSNNSVSLAQGFINTICGARIMRTMRILITGAIAAGVPRRDWPKYQGYQEMANGICDLNKKAFKYF